MRQSLRDSLAKRFAPYELQAIANEELEGEQEAVAGVDKELPPPPEPWPAEYTEKRAALESVREQAVRQHVAELYQVTDAELTEIVMDSMDRPM